MHEKTRIKLSEIFVDLTLFITLLIFLILYIFFDEEGILTLFQHTTVLKTVVCILVLLFMIVELKKIYSILKSL